MLMDFLTGLNWLDILLACLLGRIIFIGIKNGFVIELFKFFGVLFSCCFCLHYYSSLSDALTPQLPVLKPLAVRVLVFLLFWSFVTLVFKFIRDGLLILFSVTPHPVIEKWGGAVIATMRGLLICSLTMFVLLLSQNPAAVKYSQRSWSKHIVSYLAPHVYSIFYWGLVVKYFPLETLNKEVFNVASVVDAKKK